MAFGTFREWAQVSEVVGTSGLAWALWGFESLCVSVNLCVCVSVWVCVVVCLFASLCVPCSLCVRTMELKWVGSHDSTRS
jgi:hypothetical protein